MNVSSSEVYHIKISGVKFLFPYLFIFVLVIYYILFKIFISPYHCKQDSCRERDRHIICWINICLLYLYKCLNIVSCDILYQVVKLYLVHLHCNIQSTTCGIYFALNILLYKIHCLLITITLKVNLYVYKGFDKSIERVLKIECQLIHPP